MRPRDPHESWPKGCCSVCGRIFAVHTDGIRRHGSTPTHPADCPGSKQPPAKGSK